MQFLTAEDAFHRLCGNVIKIGDTPVFVNRVSTSEATTDIRAQYVNLLTKEVVLFNPNAQYLYPPKFQLGYMNFHQDRVMRPVWCERAPLRHRSFGLTTRNLYIHEYDRSQRVPYNNGLFLRDDFARMLTGSYPKISEGLASKTGFAFSPDFALVKISLDSCGLYYRTNKVGEFNEKSFKLYGAFEYLHEQLSDALEPKGEKYDIAVVETEAVA